MTRLRVSFTLCVNDTEQLREVEFIFDRKAHKSTLDAALAELAAQMGEQDYEIEEWHWLESEE